MKKFLRFLFPAIFFSQFLSAQTQIIPFGATWKYLDNGSNQGTAWRNTTNASWETGQGLFGYGVKNIITQISEGVKKKDNYVTTYFTKSFSLNPGIYSSYIGRIKRNDGAVVYINGVEVYRTNMPAGTISYNTFATNDGDKGAGAQTFPISSSSFVNGTNTIAVEIHQKKNKDNKDMAFDLELTAAASTDQTPPSVKSINRQTPSSSLTNLSTVTYKVTFSEHVSGVDVSDFTPTTVSGTTKGTVSGVKAEGNKGTTYQVTISSITGNGVLRLDLNSSGTGIIDAAGNAISRGFTSGQTYTFDFTAPVVSSINRQSPTTQNTSATSVTFRVTFSETVSGVGTTDFSLTKTNTATGTIASISGSSSVYDVTVNSITGSGDLRLDLKSSGTGITDAAGNTIAGGFTSGQVYTIQQADQTPPAVNSINRQSPTNQSTSASSVIYRVIFSEAVSGVNSTDFTVTTVNGTATGTVSAVTVVGTNNTTYDVTVSSITGLGDIRLDLNASGTGITDAAGNPISGGFTSGQVYTITSSDQTAPTVVSINRQNPTTQTTSATTVVYRVTFSEAVTGVDISDFTLNKTNTVNGTITSISGSSTVYDITVSSITGSGDLRLDLKASGTGIIDAAGNAIAGGFTSGQVYTIQPATVTTGFTSITPLSILPLSDKTADKPQGKTWTYAGKWWTVLASGGATKIFRLDGTTWTAVMTLASTNSRPDYWIVGNVVHILLYKFTSTSLIVSAEYDPVTDTYKPWSQRPGASTIQFPTGTQIGTIMVDGNGRMWVASDGTSDVSVWWSNAPYSSWSGPITLATGITDDDMCTLANLQGKIGLLWSNQNTGLFGFKTHNNGDNPNTWSADEVPASQSAIAGNPKMADNHMNVVTASDGTLYCAVKTSYDAVGLPQLALLIRRPNGVWDDLHPVTIHEGTQPIVILNETLGKVKVVYTTVTNGGDIVYRESSTSSISFSAALPLFSGGGTTLYHFASSTHQPYNPDVVIVGTNLSTTPLQSVSVLASDGTTNPPATVAIPSGMQTSINSGRMLTNSSMESTLKTQLSAMPNPLTTGTTISFTLAHDGNYNLHLQDSRGSKIAQLTQGWGRAGTSYTVSVDGSRLSSGMYLVNLQNGGSTQTIKLIVTK